MPKKIKIKNQLSPGRPKSAVDKADLPENLGKPTSGELPKKIIGSHMGSLFTSPLQTPKNVGPAIKGPPKTPVPTRKAPPSL